MPRTLRPVLLALLVLIAAVPASATLPPDQPDAGAWVPDGSINAVVRSGGSTWVSGYFNWWGPWTGSAASVSVADGAPMANFPKVAGGYVQAIEPDGSGGAYLAGDFHFVGGAPRDGLAHVGADGVLDPAFAPPVVGQVRAMQLSSDGTSLFLGGRFDSIAGQARHNLAAVAAVGGALRSWSGCVTDPGNASDDDTVFALESSTDGASLLVGGNFNGAGTQAGCSSSVRVNAAAFSQTTGTLTSWAPSPTDTVLTMSASSTVVYMGGRFTQIGTNNQPRHYLAMVSQSTGAAALWGPDPDGPIHSVSVIGTTVYAGGLFHTIGHNQLGRTSVAAIDSAGNATAFDAHFANDPVYNFTVAYAVVVTSAPQRIVVGGNFTTPSGARNTVALDPDTGAEDAAFAPKVGGSMVVGAATGAGRLIIGGGFNSVGAVPRTGIVQLDAFGHPTAWQAAGHPLGASKLALAPGRKTIYASGNFTAPDGALAAFSTESGARLPWAPDVPNYGVYALAASPTRDAVYVGGSFSSLGGAPRNNLGAVTASGTGTILPWRPDPDNWVQALAASPDGAQVYAGGTFGLIGTSVAARPRLAALSADTGDASAWNPAPDGAITALTPTADGAHIYAGGQFTHIGAVPLARQQVADLATATGNATPFNAHVDDHFVMSVVPNSDDSLVYVSGDFTASGLLTRNGLAAFDGGNGALLQWLPDPAPYNQRKFVAGDGDTISVGGDIVWIGADRRPGYAQYSVAPLSLTAPALDAEPAVGTAVGCSAGRWGNGADVTVGWLLDGAPIAGASQRSYTPGAGDAGHQLACRETGANPAATVTADSAAKTVPAPPGVVQNPPDNVPPVVPPAGKLKLAAKLLRTTRAKLVARLTLSAAATVKVAVVRLPKGKPLRFSFARRAGRSTVTLRKRHGRLRAGRYRVTFTAKGARAVRVAVRLKR
ncbi:MAG: hypothetical protein ACJ762_21115 [Solirubrobacteraceae bacterium]